MRDLGAAGRKNGLSGAASASARAAGGFDWGIVAVISGALRVTVAGWVLRLDRRACSAEADWNKPATIAVENTAQIGMDRFSC